MEKLKHELQLLQELEYADQFSERYHFQVDGQGRVTKLAEYPGLKEEFPKPVHVLELNEFLAPYSPSLVMWWNNGDADIKIPGATVIDWSQDLEELKN